MRTDKIRKYLIPNIPYLFILWAFLKLGTAYRLAAGNDFAHKFIGLGQTIGPAFADFAPGLAPLDWLIGIVGAVGFRLLIYFKSKNAKKFRRDAEYGSARWGTEKDIKPFVDPKFENNVILTGTEFLTMNTRPKIPANARNLNCCIIGSSGSGKTRFWLTPQLLQAHSSYVVVDPKGGVLGQVGAFLQKRGYKIKVFNSIDFSKSMQYNPLAYIRNEADILKFVDFRKHKTLDGCPELTPEQAEKLKADMAQSWHLDKSKPYPAYLLSNNNANIRRVRQRIEELSSRSEFAGWTFPGGEAKINEAENRLQLIFEEKPDADQRQELKSNGFKWAPSQGAWQRQLNQNAIRAAARIDFLRPEDGTSPYQLQPFVKRENKEMSR